ncbi:unnamed protein product [Soboliphyme baturini]|uniref:Chitin deacetylase n=1 Tax=Soboliphyme baturini TaxID=241478 RepID=A0A183IRW0_9BILA|nr:unnamed protein product [Soboliphyme baturini]
MSRLCLATFRSLRGPWYPGQRLSRRTGFDIPGNLRPKDTPQIVVFTIDDPVNDRMFNIYKDIFGGSVKNRNGCPITATFFVPQEYNRYDQCQWLYWKGNELAVNSITHETLSSASVTRWSDEMAGMKRLLSQLSGIHVADIKGVRAPQLDIGGNEQFIMMQQDGFMYDNSMSANPGPTGPVYWPQTLDYKIAWKCEVPRCPNASFPGIWAVPINQLYGCFLKCAKDHRRAAMVRGLMRADNTVEDVYRILINNFNRHYESNRAPFIVTLNVDFFLLLPQQASVKALESFLTEILHKEDVWVVDMQKMLEWIRHPVPVSQISQFKPWSCDTRFRDDAAPCQVRMPDCLML